MRAAWCPPLRLEPHAGEHALSYLARLGVRNGEWNAARFAADIGVSIDGLRTGRQVAALERAARLPGGTLSTWSPRSDTRSRTVRIGADTVRMQDWCTSVRRWCPACFAADRKSASTAGKMGSDGAAWHRSIWNVVALERCPEHGAELRSRCPSCDAAAGWDDASVDTCPCGTRLGSEKFSAGVQHGLSTYVADRVRGGGAAGPALLDGLPLHRSLPLVERLGLSALGTPGSRWASIGAHGAARCAARGFEIASAWPGGFVEVLDTIVAARGDEAKVRGGMTLAYGWVHEHWINPMPSDAVGTAIKAVLLEHATSNGIVSDGEALLGAERRAGTIDMSAASRLLGVAHPRATRLLGRRDLLPRGRRRSVGVVLEVAAVEAVAAQRRRRLDLEGVRGRLGIGRSQARAVASTFLRVGGHASSPDGEGWSGYDPDDLLHLTSRLHAVAVPADEVPEALLPLPRACQSAGVPLEVAIKAILEGTVGAMSRRTDAAECIPSLFVSPDALRTLRPKPTTLSLSEVAPLLRLHPEAVLELARHGAIPALRDRARWTFEREDVERFAATHVPASVVARELGTSPRKVLHDLLERGIHPAFGPPRFRQALLARSDLGRANLPIIAGFAKSGNSMVAWR